MLTHPKYNGRYEGLDDNLVRRGTEYLLGIISERIQYEILAERNLYVIHVFISLLFCQTINNRCETKTFIE